MYGMSRTRILAIASFAIIACGAVRQSSGQAVTVYQTNADQSLLLAQQPSVSFGPSGNGSTTITINPSTQYQQMDGFGASLTDSSTYLVYNKLTASQQTALMQSLFSRSSGIGLSFLRQPMGASDFSAQGNFSYDDVPSGQTDVNLTNFSIAKDQTYTIPVLKQAFAVNPNINVELLPWSPPAWMKASGTMNGGNFNDAYYAPLANYFVKAIQAYQAQGIPVYAIAAQNEPENSNANYPSETFSASEEATFIGSYLGPTLAANNLSTKIFGYEHNWNDTNYPETILSDPTAGPYTAGTSWHCYGGSVSGQSVVEAAYPSKGNWFTECTGSVGSVFGGDLAWTMENLIIGATRNYARSVSEWNLVLDQNSGPVNGGCTNCRGFVTLNDSVSPATLTYNVEYYAYGHAAKFVLPGAYRIDSNSAAAGTGGIEDVAFQNPDGSIALIVLNDGTSAASFNVAWNNEVFTYTLPAGAVATFSWPTNSNAPNAPAGLTATAVSGAQINLSWTASTTSGVSYDVFRSTSSGFTPSSSNQVSSGLTATSYSDAGLSSGTTYYYLVEAANANGTSNPSNQASAMTAAGVPTAPTNLNGVAVSNSEIDLSWTASATPGVTYSVFRSTQSGFIPSSSNLIASAVVLTSFADTCVTASQIYYYVVEALNSAGSSAPSNQAQVTATVLPPAAPSNLIATAVSSAQINLTWTASNTPKATYSIYSSTTSGFTPSTSNLIASGISTTNYSSNNLSASTTYYYVVEAVNGGGSSSPSNQASASTTAGVPASVWFQIINQTSGLCVTDTGSSTSNGTPLEQTACGNQQLNQEWQFQPTGNGYYAIYNGNATSLVWDDTGGSTANGNPIQLWAWSNNTNQQWLPAQLSNSLWTFTNLTSGLCLDDTNGSTSSGTQFQQWACTSGSTNQEFQLVQISGGSSSTPTAPSNLTATSASSSQISLGWTASTTSGVTYSVFRNTTAGFTPSSSNQIASSISATTYSDSGLTASTTYYYVVEAVNSVGPSPASNQASASTSAAGSGISTTAYYQIVNQASGSCLDDTNGSTANGTVLQQYTCYANNLNQQWLFTPTSGGYYEVTTYNSNSVAWNVVNVGTSPGTGMQLWAYGGGLNEQFEPVLLSSGYYEFIDRNSGLCLNVPGGATTTNLQLQINTCNGSTSESFQLNQQ